MSFDTQNKLGQKYFPTNAPIGPMLPQEIRTKSLTRVVAIGMFQSQVSQKFTLHAKNLFKFVSLKTGCRVGPTVECRCLSLYLLSRNPTFQIPFYIYLLLANNAVCGVEGLGN